MCTRESRWLCENLPKAIDPSVLFPGASFQMAHSVGPWNNHATVAQRKTKVEAVTLPKEEPRQKKVEAFPEIMSQLAPTNSISLKALLTLENVKQNGMMIQAAILCSADHVVGETAEWRDVFETQTSQANWDL